MSMKRGWGVIFCLGVFVVLGGVAKAATTTTIDASTWKDDGFIDIYYGKFTDGENGPPIRDVIINGDFTADKGWVNVHDGANVTFNGNITITSYGLWITPSASLGGEGTEGATAKFKGTVDVQNDGIGIRDSTADFEKATKAKYLSIDGNSKVTFHDTLTVTDAIEIMNDENPENTTGAVTEFKGNITAGALAIDSRVGSKNTFGGTVTLNGYDEDIYEFNGKKMSLAILDGTNTFVKDVTTGTASAIFAAQSTSTFSAALKAGTGDVLIGYSDMMKSLEGGDPNEEDYLPAGFYNKPATVILNGTGNTAANIDIFENGTLQLGSGSSLSATSVNVANKGTLALAGAASVTGDLAFKSGGTFTPNGNQLGVDGAVTVNQGAILKLSASDANKTIMTSTTGITDKTGAFLNNVLYTVTLSDDAKTLSVGNGIAGGGGPGAADKVLDALANGGKGATVSSGIGTNGMELALSILNAAPSSNIKQLQDNLLIAIQTIGDMSSSDSKTASIALNQILGGNGVQTTEAIRTTSQNFASSIFSRLAQLRDFNMAMNDAPVQSGGALASLANTGGSPANRVWAGGFGAFTRQDDTNNEYGYKYNSGGFILGYDRHFGDLTAGFTGAYSHGQIKGNEGYRRTDVDTMNLGLYASYNPLGGGFYAEGNAGFGYSWNDNREDSVTPGSYVDGKYQNYSFQVGGNIGYAFVLPSAFRITPTVGIQYIHVKQKAWNETNHGPNSIAHRFGSGDSNFVEVPLAVKVSKTFDLGNGMSITPEVRGAWIYDAKHSRPKVRMGYVGVGGTTTLYGVNSGRSRGLVGTGVKVRFNRCVDAFVDYNLEFRSGYQNHNVMAGLGLSF